MQLERAAPATAQFRTGGFTGDVTNFGCLYTLTGSQTHVPKCCGWGRLRVTWRMRATEPLFLGTGGKDLMFSHRFGVSSCCGASCPPPSLILHSPWVMGRTQPAPPSFGVSLRPSLSPAGDGAGQWDMPFPPLAPYQCKAAAGFTPGPYRRAGFGTLPACFPSVRWCLSPLIAPLITPAAPTLALRSSPVFPQVTHVDHAGLFPNLRQRLPPLPQTPFKPKLEQNWHFCGIWPGVT